jgi:hypothetical protein
MDVDEALSGPSLSRHRAVRRLTPADAADYRALMLEAYAIAPDAFTSSVAEREALPLQWWESRVCEGADARELVCGAFLADDLAGVAGTVELLELQAASASWPVADMRPASSPAT